MPRTPAIDVVIFPFTPVTKVETFEHAPVLKDSMVHLGIWDKEFDATSLVADMDAAGVDKVLICAQEGGSWRVSHDTTRALARRVPRSPAMDGRHRSARHHGRRASPRAGGHRARRRRRAQLPALVPDTARRPRRTTPFYAKCVELDVPIQIQVGMAFQAGLKSVGWPGSIDTMAVDFPELKIIGIHTGYPWEREMCSVAWKHPNVYIGCDCHHPRDFSPELVGVHQGAGAGQVHVGHQQARLRVRRPPRRGRRARPRRRDGAPVPPRQPGARATGWAAAAERTA